MKKIIGLIILLGLLMTVIAGCSGEPVPYSDSLKNKRACYIDVLEIIPHSSFDSEVYLYCECILEDGGSVWMKIFPDDFADCVDSEADADSIVYSAKHIKLDRAVRLNGTVSSADCDLAGGLDKVFFFDSADETVTDRIADRSSTAVQFSDSLKAKTVAYADVIRIEPKYTSSMASMPEGVACLCTTDEGEMLWLYADVDDYHSYIDATAHFSADPISPSSCLPVDLVEPVRLYGVAANTEELFTRTVTGVEIPPRMLDLRETDAEELKTAKIESQPAVEYAGDEKLKQKVYLDIKYITAEYVLNTGYTIPTGLICRCETTEGEDVWVAISIADFEDHFSDDYEDAFGERLRLSDKPRLNGYVQLTAVLSADMDDKIGRETVVVFESLEQ